MQIAFNLTVNGIPYGMVWLTQADIKKDLKKIAKNIYQLKTNPQAIYKKLW